MKAPHICPQFGFGTFPVRLLEIRDGDTVVVQVHGTAFAWAIRLADCWCKELNRGTEQEKKIGRAAKEFVRQTLSGADEGDLRLWIPLPEPKKHDQPINLLDYVTFDRIPAYLFVGPTKTINRMLVEARLASTTKDGELGS